MTGKPLRTLALVVGLSSLATCPVGVRACREDQRSREARALLGYLVREAQAYWTVHRSLPSAPAGPTPPPGACCDAGGTCAADAARWAEPTWQALRFTVDGPHRYSYSYTPDGPTAATLSARGDLDCDGDAVELSVRLEVDGDRLRATWTSAAGAE